MSKQASIGGFISLALILVPAWLIVHYYEISVFEPYVLIPLLFASITIPIAVTLCLDDRHFQYETAYPKHLEYIDFDYTKLGANDKSPKESSEDQK